MNEKTISFIWIVICCLLAIMVFFIVKSFREGRADADYQRARRDCNRAADNNRELSDEERRTRIKLEEAERANQRASDVIRQQTEDYRRAAENNQRARELVGKAKKILSDESD